MTIELTTLDGGASSISPAQIDTLRDALRGELILAGSPNYDAARRVWNGNIDRKPAVIVRCAGPADVRTAVDFARQHGALVSLRGGGHSAPGYGCNNGGMVIDTAPMKGIRIDPASRTAWVQSGALWRDFDHEAQAYGLATTGGTVSNTGVTGLTLGGGLGWLMGKHGASVDNVRSIDVVTADGRFRHASAEEHPDLYWALRGGGGNFGAVTSFEFQLHPVTETMGGLVIHPLEHGRDMLRFYRDFCVSLPDEAEAAAGLLTLPDGTKVAAMILCYNGPAAIGERVLAPARAFGRPLADTVAPMAYCARQTLIDEPNARHGLQRYWRSAFVNTLSDRLIDKLITAAADFSSPLSAILLFLVHGAATRVPADATAFCARERQWDFDVIGQWSDAAESNGHIAWVRSVWQTLEPDLRGSVYINHIVEDDRPEFIRASYGANYQRLRQIKSIYDPANLFRVNSNIPPG